MSETVQEQGGAAALDDGREASAAALQALAQGGSDAGAGPGVPDGVPIDAEAEARDVINFGVALFVPLYPSLEGVYSKEVIGRLAAVSVPLMQKYDISLGGIFEKWGPEINFAIVAVPLTQATVAAVRQDKAARQAAASAAEAAERAGGANG